MKKKLTPVNPEFKALLQLKKIEPQHLLSLSKKRETQFRKLITQILADSTGEDRDAFLEKISGLLDRDTIWEYNQCRITKAIQQHIHLYNCMPSKVVIAQATGLSRQTVHKHLQTFSAAQNPHTDMFPVMTQQVLTKLIDKAMEGDVAAAKVYLQSANKEAVTTTNDIVIKNQNNYIQINRTVLNQQAIQQLNAEQLQQIEEILIKAGIKALPSPE